ncbi:hypothetical protein ARMGADRAFT_1068314 [Armillaria gallica]|uniref:Uncharacterized protein n=1 Tax=Armillaria gallica TaxID=47427 RepID=A0A2H3CGB2_ARMGA|nr:hypothetical protein ARMGADRAFT_1068314 [Armillaria gallica]
MEDMNGFLEQVWYATRTALEKAPNVVLREKNNSSGHPGPIATRTLSDLSLNSRIQIFELQSLLGPVPFQDGKRKSNEMSQHFEVSFFRSEDVSAPAYLFASLLRAFDRSPTRVYLAMTRILNLTLVSSTSAAGDVALCFLEHPRVKFQSTINTTSGM